MSYLSNTALLLLKLDLLRRSRKGVLAKLLGRKLFTLKSATMFKAAMALLYVGVTCLWPMLTLDGIGESTQFGRDIVTYHHFLINGIVILLFYSGLFVGASMIYELAISENEQLLAYPMVMEDLVQFRIMESLLVVLNSCLFFFVPIIILIFIALGWSALWTVAMALLTTMLLVIVFLLGISMILSLAKIMPRLGADKIFIGIFLVTIVLVVLVSQLFEMGQIGTGDMQLSTWLQKQLSLYSYSSMMDSAVSRTGGIGQYALGLVAGCLLLFSMIRMCERILTNAYRRIILQTKDMTAGPKRKSVELSYTTLNRHLSFLPLNVRTLLTKDILALVRGPNLLLRALGSIIALALVVSWRHSSLADPFLFMIYFASTFVISRLFIDIVGQERNNILIIKQLYPSPARYLSVRAKITFGISTILLFPTGLLLAATATDFALSEIFYRALLLILTLGLTSILVTWYSAAFAEFSEDYIEKYKFCIHPVAMSFFWGFSALVSLFTYKLDLLILADKSDNLTIILITAMGLVLAVSMAVFKVLGIRRIKHYA